MTVCEFQLIIIIVIIIIWSQLYLTSPVEFNGICLQHLGVELRPEDHKSRSCRLMADLINISGIQEDELRKLYKQ